VLSVVRAFADHVCPSIASVVVAGARCSAHARLCFAAARGATTARPPALTHRISGAGTNLKAEGTDPAIFLSVVPLHFFVSKSTISCFGEHFCHGQYSLVSFLFAVRLLTVPPYPAICKSGGTCPVPHGVGATASEYYDSGHFYHAESWGISTLHPRRRATAPDGLIRYPKTACRDR